MVALVLLVNSVASAQRQPKPPSLITEFENQTLPLGPQRGVNPLEIDLSEVNRELNARWDETLFLETLDRVYEHSQQEFDAFDRSGHRPIGSIPKTQLGRDGILSIRPGEEQELSDLDLGGIDDLGGIADILENTGITEEDLGIEGGDEPLSDDELARQLGLEPLNTPAQTTRETVEGDDGAETERDLLQDARTWGETSETGGAPYRGNPGPTLVPGVIRTSEEIAIAILEAILEEELALLGDDDASQSETQTALTESRNDTTTESVSTGGQQSVGASSNSQSTSVSNGQEDVLERILAEQTDSAEVDSRLANSVGLLPRGGSAISTEALLDAIASEDASKLKQPGENTFSIDDLINVDPDEITDQPIVEELLAGFDEASHQELRDQADRYLPPSNTVDMNELRNRAGQLIEKINAAQRSEHERTRRQQLEAQRQAQLAEQQRRQAEQYERWRQQQQAAQYDQWRRQQIARQQAIQYEQWRRNQIARQQQQIWLQQQMWRQRQTRQQVPSGWINGRYYGTAEHTDGSILGPGH